MDTTFTNALNNWIKAVTANVLDMQVNADWMKEHGVNYMTISAEKGGQKYMRIVAATIGSSFVWAFVALEDGNTKGMGAVKKGDIFKPAGWKTPAKIARGNIFDTLNGPTCGITKWTGPNYL